MQPGQTISPGGTQETPAWQFNPETQPPSNQPRPEQPAPVPAQSTSPPAQPVQATADVDSVNWTASEFIAHSKNSGWYMMLALSALVLAAAVFLLTKDKISAGIVIIVAIIFGISASRKPRELQYKVDDEGVHIGAKSYPYSILRSFAIVQEGAVESIWLMPLKRFMPIISIYFDPKDGDKILNIISEFLPFEDREPDPVDRLMHRLRF